MCIRDRRIQKQRTGPDKHRNQKDNQRNDARRADSLFAFFVLFRFLRRFRLGRHAFLRRRIACLRHRRQSDHLVSDSIRSIIYARLCSFISKIDSIHQPAHIRFHRRPALKPLADPTLTHLRAMEIAAARRQHPLPFRQMFEKRQVVVRRAGMINLDACKPLSLSLIHISGRAGTGNRRNPCAD